MDWHPENLRWERGDRRTVLERQVEAEVGGLGAIWRWETIEQAVARGGGGRQREG